MRRIAAHKFDEVPILGIGRGIDHQVGDEGRIGMRRCSKPNRNLQVFVKDVVVDAAGNAVYNRLEALL